MFGEIESVHRVEEVPTGRNIYVIVDVKYFSSTVVELLSRGIEEVHVTEKRGDEFDFKQENNNTVIGGPTLPGYRTDDGYDFFNSPAAVRDIDSLEEKSFAALTSSNGGRAINRLSSKEDDIEIFVGSTTNAEALGTFLRENRSPSDICIVPCGTDGVPAPEDYIGATHIAAAIENIEIPDKKERRHGSAVRNSKGPYRKRPEHRQRDADIVSEFNSQDVVPYSDGRDIRDIG
ncbi:MAG: 2-phosphosulfolactate phosphatase [Candidatus Nanohaloarchaea archaeon]